MDEEFGTDEHGLDDSGLDGEGQLNLFGPDGAGDFAPPGSPWDAEVDAGWDPSDHPDAREDDGGGPEAWLRSLPPQLRAEVEARPPANEARAAAGPASHGTSVTGGRASTSARNCGGRDRSHASGPSPSSSRASR